MMARTLTTTFVLSLLASAALAYPYTSSGDVGDAYDYIIVGGGTAGLILANRLSEDALKSVLVLEAGASGDLVADQINIPDQTYFNTLTNSIYDFNYTTTPSEGLNNRTIGWPRGRVLGGSSAINAMFFVRPAEAEITAWHELLGDMDGADRWTWDTLFDAMKETETFTPPSDGAAEAVNLTFTPDFHGEDGPLQVTFSEFQSNFTAHWKPTMQAVGIPSLDDSAGGENLGSTLVPSFVNPSNWTRAYTRSGYLDPLAPRSNLVVVPEATVTRINFGSADGGQAARSVDWRSWDGQDHSVNVNQEVILAAGVMASPQLLMVSGIGPTDVLDAAGIEVVSELPGVGQHLQDHLLVSLYFENVNGTQTLGDLQESVNTPQYGAAVNTAVSYVNLVSLFGEDNKNTLVQEIQNTQSATPSDSDEVKAGTEALWAKTVDLFEAGTGASMEILMSVMGTGSIGFQASLQHPLSFGRLYVNSSDIFAKPIIEANYLQHQSDLTILREGAKFIRKLANTEPLSRYLATELQPGTETQSDEQWESWIRDAASSQFHPRGGCVMLPREQGGVVDARLRVYGTTNVRVADGSVFPLDMSTHTQAPTIGLAEIAADIIQGNGVSRLLVVGWVAAAAPLAVLLFVL
ncbi:GMC oxidoreductase [Cylindrobasidium torrendii FP15055 ss-10]|uniref:GMC oxidoreductase n=1 Tax=Cylindrobasidium torrendii FP15055 ss-10 TaxID=1314674 RepID=A0A0D7BBX3_9AGAR|nr:GMC oxidoreductase [Cylindrobasidium torrendii FP15055 ss-10]